MQKNDERAGCPTKKGARSQPRSHSAAELASLRHTRLMFRHSTFATVLWVLAVALLPVRMANAHLHLCLDGQERPVSLHVQDIATHSGAEPTTDQGHNDRDVDVSASLLTVKLSGGMDDAPLVIHLYVLTPLLPVERPTFSLIDLPSAELTSVVTLRPPVRGPPV